MRYYIGLVAFDSEPHLVHYGIKGMKWGVRRYQNADGTRTAEGKERYKYGKTTPMTAEDRYKVRNTKLYKKAVDVVKRMKWLDKNGDPDKEYDVRDAELMDITEKIVKKYGNASMSDMQNVWNDVWDDVESKGDSESIWAARIDKDKKLRQTVKDAKKDRAYNKGLRVQRELRDLQNAHGGTRWIDKDSKDYPKQVKLNNELKSIIDELASKYGKTDENLDWNWISDSIFVDAMR